jgi:polyamine oxidase
MTTPPPLEAAAAAASAASSPAPHVRVLVLGAGMAGIACARALVDGGVADVLVLEGQSRVGGRVACQLFGQHVIELGANWIHGNPPQPLWALAHKARLATLSDEQLRDSDRVFSEETGPRPVPSRLMRWQHFDSAYDRFEKEKRRLKKQGAPDELMSEVFARCGWSPVDALDRLVDWVGIDWDYAVPSNATGTLAKPDERELWGDVDHFVCDPRGYAEIIRHLAGDLLESRVRLNSTVVQVQTLDDGSMSVLARESGGGGGDGALREYRADAVVVTFSQGVLAQCIHSQLVSFVPALPPWKAQAILSIQMAHYCKVFLRFDTAFWDNVETLYFAANERGHWPAWQNLNALPAFRGSNILIATLTGEKALRACALSDEEVQQEAVGVLKTMYPAAGQQQPISFLFTRWPTDRWSFGSYSCFGLGTGPRDAELLAKPVGNLYFSGEATHGLHYGTLHGALLAGAATARALLSSPALTARP